MNCCPTDPIYLLYTMNAAWQFDAKHDWASSPMPSYVAWIMFASDLWTWSKYYTERGRYIHDCWIYDMVW